MYLMAPVILCHCFGVTGEKLSPVLQGALRDSWLVSALNIFLSSSDILRRLLVSDRHRDKGIRRQAHVHLLNWYLRIEIHTMVHC